MFLGSDDGHLRISSRPPSDHVLHPVLLARDCGQRLLGNASPADLPCRDDL